MITINKDDKMKFCDRHKDGSTDEYYLTFRELENTFGYQQALRIWVNGYVYKKDPFEYDEMDGFPYEDLEIIDGNSIYYINSYDNVISSLYDI